MKKGLFLVVVLSLFLVMMSSGVFALADISISTLDYKVLSVVSDGDYIYTFSLADDSSSYYDYYLRKYDSSLNQITTGNWPVYFHGDSGTGYKRNLLMDIDSSSNIYLMYDGYYFSHIEKYNSDGAVLIEKNVSKCWQTSTCYQDYHMYLNLYDSLILGDGLYISYNLDNEGFKGSLVRKFNLADLMQYTDELGLDGVLDSYSATSRCNGAFYTEHTSFCSCLSGTPSNDVDCYSAVNLSLWSKVFGSGSSNDGWAQLNKGPNNRIYVSWNDGEEVHVSKFDVDGNAILPNADPIVSGSSTSSTSYAGGVTVMVALEQQEYFTGGENLYLDSFSVDSEANVFTVYEQNYDNPILTQLSPLEGYGELSSSEPGEILFQESLNSFYPATSQDSLLSGIQVYSSDSFVFLIGLDSNSNLVLQQRAKSNSSMSYDDGELINTEVLINKTDDYTIPTLTDFYVADGILTVSGFRSGQGFLASEALPLLCYHDADGDGHANPSSYSQTYGQCTGDYYSTADDCDDGNANIHPGGTEICGNALDEDCDGVADSCGVENTAALCSDGSDNDADGFIDCSDSGCDAFCCSSGTVTCYYDGDGDGYYSSSDTPTDICLDDGDCSSLGSGWTQLNPTGCPYDSITSDYTGCQDCNDADPMETYLCCDSGEEFVYWKTNSDISGLHRSSNDYAWLNPYDDLVGAGDPSGALNYFEVGSSYDIYNKYLGACCSSSDMCVGIDFGSLSAGTNNYGYYTNCISPGLIKKYGGDDSSDGSIVCTAGGEWSDCDRNSSTAASCGFDYVKPGFAYADNVYYVNVSGVSTQANFENAFSEFQYTVIDILGFTSTGVYVPEACGDDLNEQVVSKQCRYGGNGEDICCPTDNVYANYLGTCIPEEDCPDTQFGVPVWVPAPDASLKASWDSQLVANGEGYCCDGTNTGKPLCGSSNDGCFVKEQTFDVATSSVDLCDATTSDNYCVVETCSGDFSVCQETEVCVTTVNEIEYTTYSNPSIVDGYVVTEETTSYVDWSDPTGTNSATAAVTGMAAQATDDFQQEDSGSSSEEETVGEDECNPAARCEARTVQIVDKTNCHAFCDRENLDSTSAGEFFNCKEVCDYTTEDFVVYSGLDCYANCDIEGTKDVVKVTGIEIPSSGATFLALNCNTDVCSNDGNTQNIEEDNEEVEADDTLAFQGRFVTGGSSEYSTANTVCTTETVCNDLECTGNSADPENKICMTAMDDFGNALYVRDNTNGDLMQCRGEDQYPRESITEGDPWCPKEFKYAYNGHLIGDPLTCFLDKESCDSGFAGQLEHGCNEVTSIGDDYWNQYNSACFNSTEGPTNTYNEGCCLTTVIAGFNVYQFDNVKIY